MARYNTISSTSSVAGGSIITTPSSGLLTTLTGSGTVTVPNPVLYTGQSQTFYNSTGSAITLSTPSGAFITSGVVPGSTISLPASSIITIVSDGTNYDVTSWVGGSVVTGSLTATGGTINGITIGGSSAAAGTFSTLSSTGILGASGVVTFTNNAAITVGNTSTGALQVTGGASFGGGINANGTSSIGGYGLYNGNATRYINYYLGQNTDPNTPGTVASIILLIPDPSGTVNENHMSGILTANRGSSGSGNDHQSWNIQIQRSYTGYTLQITPIGSANFLQFVTCTYGATTYFAIDTAGIGLSAHNWNFDGIFLNNTNSQLPTLVARTSVGSITNVSGSTYMNIGGVIVQNSTGTIGINQTSPNGALDVAGDLYVGSTTNTARFKSDGTHTYVDAIPTNGNVYIRTNGAVTAATILSGGGISTTSATTNAGIAASNSGTTGYAASFSGLAQTYTGTGYGAQDPYDPAGTLVTITSLPNAVNSGALITFNAYNSGNGATGAHIGAVAGPTGNGPANLVIGRRTGTSSWAESLRVDYNGYVLIGYSSNQNSNALQVNGNISASGVFGGRHPLAGESFAGSGGGSGWIRFGTWYTGQGGCTLHAKLVCHNGYNATVGQNCLTEVFFKTSNGSSTQGGTGGGSFYGDGYAIQILANTSSPSGIRFVQVSTSQYEMWCNFGSFTENSHFTVSFSNNTSWTTDGASSNQSAPTSYTYLDISIYSNTYSSDDNLKDIVGNIDNVFDIIDAVDPFEYQWKEEYRSKHFLEDAEDDATKHYGISAQQLEKVAPDLVETGKENILGSRDFKSVKYEQLTPILWKAIKMMRAEIADLKSQINKN
jgi:Chaperone of endosialidase